MDQLKAELKSIYEKPHDKNDVKIRKLEVDYLSSLAEVYHKRALKYKDERKQPHSHWTDFLRSHALYNSCAARELSKEQKLKWQKAAFQLQRDYWVDKGGIDFSDQLKITDELRTELMKIRMNLKSENFSTVKLTVDKIDEQETDVESRRRKVSDCSKAFKKFALVCNNNMIGFLKDLFSQCVAILKQKPPCSFVVVAIGSIAKGEATPYSDVEYFFIIETFRDLAYFELLAMVSYFLIGNLMETNLKYMSIPELKKWFNDTAINGMKIDGLSGNAGNIPTGNGSTEKENHFIGTVTYFLELYENTLNAAADKTGSNDIIGDLSDMLSHTVALYSYGDGAPLLQEFKEKKSKILVQEVRDKKTIQTISADIKKFDFLPSEDLEGNKRLHTKSMLYRYPSILIFDLKILLHIESDNSWETLERLEEKCSESFGEALRFLFAACFYIRCDSYLFYNSQHEDISVLEPRNDVEESSLYYVHKALFVTVCSYMLPLKVHLRSTVDQLTDEVLKKKPSGENTAVIESCLMRKVNQDVDFSIAVTEFYRSHWQAAVKAFKRQFKCEDTIVIAQNILAEHGRVCGHTPEDMIYFFVTALFYANLREESEKVYKLIINYYEKKGREKLVAKQYERLGRAYNGVAISIAPDTLEEGMVWYKKSIEIREQLVKRWEREENEEKLLESRKRLADVLSNMSTLHRRFGDVDSAFKVAESALKIRIEAYLGQAPYHPKIADSYYNLGSYCRQVKRFRDSEDYLNECLKIRKYLYGDTTSIDAILDAYVQLGILYADQHMLEKSLENFNHAKAMSQQQRPDDEGYIGFLNGQIGNAYLNCNKFEDALSMHEQTLNIYFKLNGTKETMHYARMVYNIGLNHYASEKFDDAVPALNEAVGLFRSISFSGPEKSYLIQSSFDMLNKIYDLKPSLKPEDAVRTVMNRC